MKSPFPGIRPFSEEEAPYFFGRNDHIRQCLNLLAHHRTLTILGVSGAGKSSLINAGLLPAIKRGVLRQVTSPSMSKESLEAPSKARNKYQLRSASFMPGTAPIEHLASALLEAGDNKLKVSHAELVKLLRTSSSTSVEGLLREIGWVQSHDLLVIADQFEELFAYSESSGDSEEAARLIATLSGLASCKFYRAYVLIGMRSDFAKEVSRLSALSALIAKSLFIAPALTHQELSSSVQGGVQCLIDADKVSHSSNEEILKTLPVLQEVRDFVTSLLNLLPRGLHENASDSLPLLQDFLARNFFECLSDEQIPSEKDRQPTSLLSRRFIDQARNKLANPVSDFFLQSLDSHGEKIWQEAEVDKSKLGTLLACLVRVDSTGRVVRRKMPGKHLRALTNLSDDDVQKVDKAFGGEFPAWVQGLNETEVTLSHEALLRNWRRFSALGQPGSLSSVSAGIATRCALFVDTVSDLRRRAGEATTTLSAERAGCWKKRMLLLLWALATPPEALISDRREAQLKLALRVLDSPESVWLKLDHQDQQDLLTNALQRNTVRRRNYRLIVAGVVFAIVAALWGVIIVKEKAKAAQDAAVAAEQAKAAQDAAVAAEQAKAAQDAAVAAEQAKAVKDAAVAAEQAKAKAAQEAVLAAEKARADGLNKQYQELQLELTIQSEVAKAKANPKPDDIPPDLPSPQYGFLRDDVDTIDLISFVTKNDTQKTKIPLPLAVFGATTKNSQELSPTYYKSDKVNDGNWHRLLAGYVVFTAIEARDEHEELLVAWSKTKGLEILSTTGASIMSIDMGPIKTCPLDVSAAWISTDFVKQIGLVAIDNKGVVVRGQWELSTGGKQMCSPVSPSLPPWYSENEVYFDVLEMQDWTIVAKRDGTSWQRSHHGSEWVPSYVNTDKKMPMEIAPIKLENACLYGGGTTAMVISGGGTIVKWDLPQLKDARVTKVAVQPLPLNGYRWIAAGMSNGYCLVRRVERTALHNPNDPWKLGENTLALTQGARTGAEITALALASTKDMIATGDSHGVIRIWANLDSRLNEVGAPPLIIQPVENRKSPVKALRFDPSSETLVAVRKDKTAMKIPVVIRAKGKARPMTAEDYQDNWAIYQDQGGKAREQMRKDGLLTALNQLDLKKPFIYARWNYSFTSVAMLRRTKVKIRMIKDGIYDTREVYAYPLDYGPGQEQGNSFVFSRSVYDEFGIQLAEDDKVKDKSTYQFEIEFAPFVPPEPPSK